MCNAFQVWINLVIKLAEIYSRYIEWTIEISYSLRLKTIAEQWP